MNRALIATPLAAAALLIAASPAAAHDPHPVQPGDTLSGIAAQHDTTWPTLWRANLNIIADPDLIYPGQKLVVEGRAKSVSRNKPAAAPTATVVRPATGRVTSGYGWRTHPITGVYKLHTGTDFAVGDGIARAAKAGTVRVEYPEWAGNLVVVDHGGGVVTQYAHLASVSVAPGEQVSAGQVVGRIGERGWTTGPHLHFEVLVGGDYVNPLAWLERNGAT